MNPFSRKDWKRSARKVQRGEGGPGWIIAAALLVVAVIVVLLRQ